jgi:hypothetical protein
MPRPPTTASGRILADLEWLVSDPRGRRILWRLWQSTGVFGPAVVDNSLQAYAEGRRSVGLEYWQGVVTLSPTAASLALQENCVSEVHGRRRRAEQPDPSDERAERERWDDIVGDGEPDPEDGPGTAGR